MMSRGVSAKTLLLIGIAFGVTSPAFAENLPEPKPVESEVVKVEGDEWIPLPVPKPATAEIAELQAGSDETAYGGAEDGDLVVTGTTMARMPDVADPDTLRQLVAEEAETNGVPAALADAVVTVESQYDPNAEGSAGEIGLMQIKPDTARLLGFRGPDSALFHPVTNLRWGMRYLAEAQRQSGGTVCGTILKYNAGHGAKEMNPISQAYCEKVKALLRDESA